ncbi:MAG: hypothetical protein HY858_00880 [Candidatus Solibacter usitatus]|nr:hypothetical protein [Candidatus Solibacter usitatus]
MNPPLTPERAELLLGGFATGTLTPAEHASLMAAAMADQRVFDALMDEEALRDALADPQTRAGLIRALAPARTRLWRAPWPWAALATAAAAVAVFVLLRPQQPLRTAAPAAPQQIAQNLPRVEPQPVEIPVPARLTLQPETERARTKDLNKADALPAAAPAPPAEMRQRLEDDRAARPLAAPAQPVALEEVAATPAPGRVEARKDQAAGPLVVALAFQQPDGAWKALDPGAAAPSGRGLRLRVTSERNGILSFNPPLAPPAPVQAGEPLTVILPGRPAGELAFRVSLAPPLGGAAESAAPVFKARAAADAAVGNLAAGAPARRDSEILVKDIRLKIE